MLKVTLDLKQINNRLHCIIYLLLCVKFCFAYFHLCIHHINLSIVFRNYSLYIQYTEKLSLGNNVT